MDAPSSADLRSGRRRGTPVAAAPSGRMTPSSPCPAACGCLEGTASWPDPDKLLLCLSVRLLLVFSALARCLERASSGLSDLLVVLLTERSEVATSHRQALGDARPTLALTRPAGGLCRRRAPNLLRELTADAVQKRPAVSTWSDKPLASVQTYRQPSARTTTAPE